MNLAQMQMAYGQAPNGKTLLVPYVQKFASYRPTRARQAEHRAAKFDYRPRYDRPRHDSEWK